MIKKYPAANCNTSKRSRKMKRKYPAEKCNNYKIGREQIIDTRIIARFVKEPT